MALNIYYVIMSFVGIVMWIKASKQTSEGAYHLERLPRKVLITSLVATVVGIPALIILLRVTHGQETALDAVAFAGAHHRADVLRLEKVFQHDGEMAGAVRQHRLYARVAFRRDEGAQIGNEFGFLSACEAVEKFLFEFLLVFSPHDAL